MANVHAAIKQIRKDAKKSLHNQSALSELKTLWAQLTKLPPRENEKGQALAHTLVSKWDRACSRGIVPRGRADRKKARIASFLKKFTSAP